MQPCMQRMHISMCLQNTTSSLPSQPMLLATAAAADVESMSADIMLHRAPRVHIPTAASANRQVQHVRGRGTVDEAQRRTSRPLPPSRVSSHDCIGDMSTVKPRASRACVFRRVCLSTASGQFLYFRDGNTTLRPVLFDQRYGHIFSFGHVAPKGGREDLLPLNKHVRYKRHVRWSPRIVDGPIPRSAPVLQPLHLLSAPFVPTNLGHLVWEEAFPLLLAMAQLGEYSERTVILRTHGCNETIAGAEPITASAARLCRKFVEGFVRPLEGSVAGHRSARHASNGPLETVASLRARYLHVPYVCFSRLLAGGYHDVFNLPLHAGKEPLLALYRHRVLVHHGLVPAHGPPLPITTHSLLLVRKQGRRGIHNLDEVLRFVRDGCGGGCTDIHKERVHAVEFHTMTIREQLRMVSTATIAVSPPGGVSMILPFLPDGAHAILLNYMLSKGAEARGTERHGSGAEGCSSCSLTMEASLWRHVRHVRKLYYQVWEPSDFARGKAGRDAAVVVKLPRLSFLIRVALNAMAEAPEAEHREVLE